MGNWEDQARAQSCTPTLKRAEENLGIHLSLTFRVHKVKAKVEL